MSYELQVTSSFRHDNWNISVLLLLGGGVPRRGEVVGKKRIPY